MSDDTPDLPTPEPAPEPAPEPDPVRDADGLIPPYSTSSLLRAVRAADGDDLFAARVRAACWQQAVPYTDDLRQRVALDPTVNAGIRVDRHGTVSTSNVTDDAILTAVAAHAPTEPTT